MGSRQKLDRSLFWIVARTCFTLYRWFPVFGPLRASLVIIRRNQQFLVIERNDGRGLSLPGGIARWKEAEEEALRREVLEETGLRVTRQELLMSYHSTADVPSNIFVFEVRTTGELKSSWEGSPRWLTVAEIERAILKSQRPVVDLLIKISVTTHEGSQVNR